MECPAERECAHVSKVPNSMRKMLAAEGKQGRRGVHSIYSETSINKVLRYRFTATAADIEYCCVLREERRESIEPPAFVPAYSATVGYVVMSMPFVEVDDLIGVRVHAERITVGTFLAVSLSHTRPVPRESRER